MILSIPFLQEVIQHLWRASVEGKVNKTNKVWGRKGYLWLNTFNYDFCRCLSVDFITIIYCFSVKSIGEFALRVCYLAQKSYMIEGVIVVVAVVVVVFVVITSIFIAICL